MAKPLEWDSLLFTDEYQTPSRIKINFLQPILVEYTAFHSCLNSTIILHPGSMMLHLRQQKKYFRTPDNQIILIVLSMFNGRKRETVVAAIQQDDWSRSTNQGQAYCFCCCIIHSCWVPSMHLLMTLQCLHRCLFTMLKNYAKEHYTVLYIFLDQYEYIYLFSVF